MGSLDGVKVLDLSRLLPGPYCSMVLADHGAEVIAIEGRRFAEDDLYFTEIYRNKKHMTLNLKSDEGKKIFYRLAREADVVIEGFRPGVAARLGVGYDDVSKVNPAVVYCSISGYGQTGDLRQKAGHDVNYLCRSGVLGLIGEREGPPTIPGVQIADIAGGMNGVIGIMMALFERNISGRGQFIDISMTDSLLGFLTVPMNLQKKSGCRQERAATIFSHRYACYNTYETADGRYFALGAVENRFWRNLCEQLDMPELITQQYNEDQRDEIIAMLRVLFLQKPLKHWQELLSDADVCFSTVKSMDEVMTDDMFIQRHMVETVDSDAVEDKTFGVAVKMSRTPGSLRTPPQPFGGATKAILQDLGYSEDEIHNFFENEIV